MKDDVKEVVIVCGAANGEPLLKQFLSVSMEVYHDNMAKT